MLRLTCRPCDQVNGAPRGAPSRVYVCPECRCGWNNDPWGRHGHHVAVAHALVVNTVAITLIWALANHGWGVVPTMLTVAGFLFTVRVSSWALSWLEDVYDPPEDPHTRRSLGDPFAGLPVARPWVPPNRQTAQR